MRPPSRWGDMPPVDRSRLRAVIEQLDRWARQDPVADADPQDRRTSGAAGTAARELLDRARASALGMSVLASVVRSEEHTSELQSRQYLVCRLLLEKKKKT